MRLKVLAAYKGGEQFGMEMDFEDAIDLLEHWKAESDDFVYEGYGFLPSEIIKIELFDLIR